MQRSQPISINAADFGRLFEQYRPNFVVVARSYVRDPMVAEDIVNDCFILFWENREKIDLAQNIPGYILTSVKNRCLNHLRDQSTRLKAQRDIHSSALRLMAQQIATLETNDPESLFAGEIALIIENELKMMPEGTRSIFLAARFEDMTYKQVAEKFGLSVNQVSFEIRKASKILQEAFKDYTATILMLYKAIDISL